MILFRKFGSVHAGGRSLARPRCLTTMSATLKNKNVAVVGASRGIGLEVVFFPLLYSPSVVQHLNKAGTDSPQLPQVDSSGCFQTLNFFKASCCCQEPAHAEAITIDRVQFARQLLGRGCTVHATARKPDQAKGLQELASEKLSIGQLDTGDEKSIKAWAKKLKGQQQFDVRAPCLQLKWLTPGLYITAGSLAYLTKPLHAQRFTFYVH